MWFFFALITCCAWGAADLFYKKGASESDAYSHLKTAMTVGVVMGVHALGVLIFGRIDYDPINILVYLPVSLMYALSMTVGYYGLRYLALSISSPVQNSSGALTCILCVVILKQSVDALSAVGVALICGGVFALGVIERKKERELAGGEIKRYAFGFTAFMIPVAYCVIDALGRFLTRIISIV